MSNTIKQVYTFPKVDNALVEIQPEYVYMRIPAEYVCIYHKLLVMFSDFGLEMLDDCSASCSNKNKNIINCFNMFNAAIAARQLGNHKLANNLINYIKGQLNIEYSGDAPCPEIVYPVDEEGKIYAMIGCAERPKFYVDAETGKLWQEGSEKAKNVYSLSDYDITANSNDSFTGEG